MGMTGRTLDENARTLRRIMKGDSTLKERRLICRGTECAVFFCDGLASAERVAEDVVRPLLKMRGAGRTDAAVLEKRGMFSGEVKRTGETSELARGLMDGDAVLLCAGCGEGLILGVKGYSRRAPSEPDPEKVSKGPREGFCEVLQENLAMIRRRLRTDKLCFESLSLGSVSRTPVCLCWIEGTADERVLGELRRRLEKVSFDGVLDTDCISEQIRDARYSPFRTVGTTERPDVVAGTSQKLSSLLRLSVPAFAAVCVLTVTLGFVLKKKRPA